MFLRFAHRAGSRSFGGPVALPITWLLFFVAPLGYAGAPQVAEDPQALVRQVVTNELESRSADLTCWRYIIQSQEAGRSRTEFVVETPKWTIKRLLALDGAPLPPQHKQREDERIRHLTQDAHDLEKQGHEDRSDVQKLQSMLKMLPDAFIYKREWADAKTIRLTFQPNPDFSPPTFESKIFRVLEGSMLVDAGQKRLIQIRGRLFRHLDFGWGIIGKLNEGGSLELRQQQIEPGLWVVSSYNLQVTGRAWFFKTIGRERQELRSAFRRIPKTITPEAAAEMANIEAREWEYNK